MRSLGAEHGCPRSRVVVSVFIIKVVNFWFFGYFSGARGCARSLTFRLFVVCCHKIRIFIIKMLFLLLVWFVDIVILRCLC